MKQDAARIIDPGGRGYQARNGETLMRAAAPFLPGGALRFECHSDNGFLRARSAKQGRAGSVHPCLALRARGPCALSEWHSCPTPFSVKFVRPPDNSRLL